MGKAIVTILNTLFFKTTHYQTLGYKIEKFSEKLFNFSLVVLGLCLVGFFVEPFVRHAWFGGVPSGYIFVGIGILTFFVLLSAPILEDTRQIVVEKPKTLKKHEVKNWKRISGNHDNIDVYFLSFPTMTEFAAMKVGEKYSNWEVTSYTAYNFLSYIFESYVTNYKTNLTVMIQEVLHMKLPLILKKLLMARFIKTVLSMKVSWEMIYLLNIQLM